MATIYSGTTYLYTSSGGGVSWTISDAGVLNINRTNVSGGSYNGYFWDGTLSSNLSLTDTMISKVKSIVFGSGTVLYLNGNNLFLNKFTNLESVTLSTLFAQSNNSKGTKLNLATCFKGLSKLKTISFPSSWSNISITNAFSMFDGCTSITSINLSNLNLQDVSDASCMFRNCVSLTSVSFRNNQPFKNTTTMYSMFQHCKNLTTINGFSYIQTSNVTSMGCMFEKCEKITSISLANFNTAKVTSAIKMFCGCIGLTSITFGSDCTFALNTDFSSMFYGCTALATINGLNYINTASANYLQFMFCNCSSLATAIDFSKNTHAVTDANRMFYGCGKIPSITFGTESTFENTTNMYCMFYACGSLTAINGFNYVTASACENMSYMFASCEKLVSLDVASLSTSNVTTMCSMFDRCKSVTMLNVSGFNTARVTDMSYMFTYCQSLTALDLSGFSAASLVTAKRMFAYCSTMQTLSFGSLFTCSNAITLEGMFCGCNALIALDLSYFSPSNCTDFSCMFLGCEELTTTGIASNFNTSSATSFDRMFLRCYKLQSVDLSGFNTANVTNMKGMFNLCRVLTGIDVSGFNTANVTDMSFMFCGDPLITTLRVSNFNTAKVTSFECMFESTAVSTLDLSNFVTINVKSMRRMFYNCKDLTSLNLSSFNTTEVTDMEHMFYNTLRLEAVTIGLHFTTDALDDGDARTLDFAPATNTTTTEAVIDDTDFINLTTLEKQGIWNRTVVNAFDATAYRSAGGYEEETGNDVTFYIRWVTSAVTADRTVTIYKKLSYVPTYPSEPETTIQVEGNAGSQDITLENVGNEAYDFRLEFYDGTDTYFAFPSIESTTQIIIFTQDGNILMRMDEDATIGDDYDLYQTLITLGWDQDVLS